MPSPGSTGSSAAGISIARGGRGIVPPNTTPTRAVRDPVCVSQGQKGGGRTATTSHSRGVVRVRGGGLVNPPNNLALIANTQSESNQRARVNNNNNLTIITTTRRRRCRERESERERGKREREDSVIDSVTDLFPVGRRRQHGTARTRVWRVA